MITGIIMTLKARVGPRQCGCAAQNWISRGQMDPHAALRSDLAYAGIKRAVTYGQCTLAEALDFEAVAWRLVVSDDFREGCRLPREAPGHFSWQIEPACIGRHLSQRFVAERFTAFPYHSCNNRARAQSYIVWKLAGRNGPVAATAGCRRLR